MEEYIQTTPKKPDREFQFKFILSVKRWIWEVFVTAVMTKKNTTMEATEREIKSWFIWIRFVAEYQFKRNRKCMHCIYLPRNEGLEAQETTRCFFYVLVNGTTSVLSIPQCFLKGDTCIAKWTKRHFVFQCAFITSQSVRTICCQWRIDVPTGYAKPSNVYQSSWMPY